jgi:trimethylamine--corrinoid protein Co-methyltransferase
VHLDRGLVRELIATIPESFTLHARDPAQEPALRRDHSDLRADDRRALSARSRRRAPPADAGRSGDLSQAGAHVAGAALLGAPHRRADGHEGERTGIWHHLSSIEHSDKTFMGMTTSPKNAEDVMEMCAILFGEEVHGDAPGLHRQLQRQFAAGLGRDHARRHARLLPRNQPVLCSPFVLGGANTPASTAPAVAQLNAEALSALAYTQVIRKGARRSTGTTCRPFR